jgi:hypothetical protein
MLARDTAPGGEDGGRGAKGEDWVTGEPRAGFLGADAQGIDEGRLPVFPRLRELKEFALFTMYLTSENFVFECANDYFVLLPKLHDFTDRIRFDNPWLRIPYRGRINAPSVLSLFLFYWLFLSKRHHFHERIACVLKRNFYLLLTAPRSQKMYYI